MGEQKAVGVLMGYTIYDLRFTRYCKGTQIGEIREIRKILVQLYNLR